MWQIDNRTPFAVERAWVRDREGVEVWLVVVKATFDIKPDGSTEISSVQPPVLHVPEYIGEPGKSSIKYEADLILSKKTTDILVVGHAYAPVGYTATRLDVGFKVGPVTKLLRVSGDRHWQDGRPTEPKPFTKMPLIYERAFGGVDRRSEHPECDWDWRNPLGTGFAVSKAHLLGVPLPNLEHPQQLIESGSERPEPAGFGAIGAHWQPRVAFAGTYDEHWLQHRQPLLPEDFDERFFQCAPLDQQTPHFLSGGEAVALSGLTAEGQVLRFFLPRLHLGFETRFYDGSLDIHKTKNLHTVILEPDFPRVSLVWHSALPCHFRVQKLQRTRVTLKAPLREGAALQASEAEVV